MENIFKRYCDWLTQEGTVEEKTANHFSIITTFYSEDIIQIENTDPPIQGREILLNVEQNNLTTIQAIKTVLDHVHYDTSTDMAWGEMTLYFENSGGQQHQLTQAFRQQWKNGEITHQHFYYDKIKTVDE